MATKTCSLLALARPALISLKGSPFAVDGHLVMVVGDDVGGGGYCRWLRLWRGPGFFGGDGAYPLLVLVCSL